MGGLATSNQATELQVVDHPTWQCPGDDGLHKPDLACCPCDHGLGGCCLHEPGADPSVTHEHECVQW